LGMVNEAVIKAMGAFGGGIASTGRVCGALLGGVALISSIYSRGNLEEKEDPRMWRLSYKLSKIFEGLTEPYGSINCKDIARVDWRDKEASKGFYKNPDSRRNLCVQLVGDLAYALGELLDKETRGAT
ncbi:MAG: C-GCAxxG-C-C family protein, partial [Pseudomonadota bacterium]